MLQIYNLENWKKVYCKKSIGTLNFACRSAQEIFKIKS